MNRLAEVTAELVILFSWIGGIVLAKGFWSTLAACFIPFWAWYLVVEALFIRCGLV